MAKRKRYLFVCVNERAESHPMGCCSRRGGLAIRDALKAALVSRGMAKTEVRACTSSCHDICWAGPCVSVMPDDYFYGRVTLDDVPEIVDALENNRRVERLVLPPEDFDIRTARKDPPAGESSADD